MRSKIEKGILYHTQTAKGPEQPGPFSGIQYTAQIPRNQNFQLEIIGEEM